MSNLLSSTYRKREMIFLDKLFVDLGKNSYNILFSTDFSGLSSAVKEVVKSPKILIVTDSNVEKLYKNEVEKLLTDAGFSVSVHTFSAGEENKNLKTIEGICKAAVDSRLDRKSTILALGGGVVGDMAGFAAAIYMRGIDFIQVPTTLLSQSDSSVGGKTGIDFEGGKNILGAFHQPKLVYINTNVLKTLPEREFVSGMGEVIKHGIIADKEFFEYVSENFDAIRKLDNDILLKMCKKNCSIKARVVSQDEKEHGIRAHLNFGHTIGHAIESYFDYTLTHGECVGIGMCAAAHIAKKRGLIDDNVFNSIGEILLKYGFRTKLEIDDAKKVLEIMYLDKKTDNGKLTFVLPTSIGEVIKLSDISDDEILDSLESIRIREDS